MPVALAELESLRKEKPAGGDILFRMSIAWEICGRRQEALDALAATLRAGYSIREVRNEPELTAVRNDVRYHRMVQ
jgi:hypothetical protein